MNIRKIKLLRRRSWLGKLLRLPFRLIPKGAVLPVLFGYLRKKRWIKGSHNLSVLFGTYERRQSREFHTTATSKKVFWDLGAHVGYYSLLYHIANPSGTSFAFEPLPLNAELYKRHMEMNSVANHELFVVAVSDTIGTLTFNTGRTSVAGKLSSNGTVKVDVIRLSDWVNNQKIPAPDLIKMDIEGEELKVLKDIESVLRSQKPDLFLSTHGKEVHSNCIQFLESLNYAISPLDGGVGQGKELLAKHRSHK